MARRRLRIGAGERMQRVRRISTTFGRVYLGLRTHRWIERRLGPSDMEERWRRFHRSSAQSVYDLAVDPYETKNLVRSHAGEAARLKGALLERVRTLGGDGEPTAEPVDRETLEKLKALGYAP